jgi:hypothetical protein
MASLRRVDRNTTIKDLPQQFINTNRQLTQVGTWTNLKASVYATPGGNFTLDPTFDSDYDTEIAVTSRVSIQGNCAVLDTSGSGRFFSVWAGGSLTLESITLANGHAYGDDSHVRLEGTFAVRNSTDSCGQGGAIHVASGTINVIDAVLKRNSAEVQ